MINRSIALAAAIGVFSLAACDSNSGARGDVANDSTAMEAIAGDKAKVAEVMRRAHARGTFDDAVALVLADSAMAYDLFGALRSDPRFSATHSATSTEMESNATAGGSMKSKAVGLKTPTRSTSNTTPPKGDVLDQAERKAQQANEKLEQAARIKKEAEQAKRTVDDIIGRK